MANKVKETENKKKLSMVEISLLGVAVEKGGKILDEMVSGKSILEYTLHEAEMSIKLDDNEIDNEGNRFTDKGLLGVKGKSIVSEKMKKEWEAKGLLKNQSEYKKSLEDAEIGE